MDFAPTALLEFACAAAEFALALEPLGALPLAAPVPLPGVPELARVDGVEDEGAAPWATIVARAPDLTFVAVSPSDPLTAATAFVCRVSPNSKVGQILD